MKKLLKPKLAQEKITVIEDSSSQEELEENEDSNVKEMKGKKQVISEDKLAFTQKQNFRNVKGSSKESSF